MSKSARSKSANPRSEAAKPTTAPACQLYLISPSDVSGAFPERLERALDATHGEAGKGDAGTSDAGVATAGPVAAFQFRVKGIDSHEAANLAAPLLDICRARDVAFIVNDSVSLARRLGADGVHLGQGDGDVREAREALGDEVQIGVTCHASRHLAMDAGEAGADYVAFGAFYPSTTKPSEHRPDLELLEWWSRIFEIPSVAIGGITPENCTPLISAGADFLAVSAAIWDGDEVAAVRAFAERIAAARARPTN